MTYFGRLTKADAGDPADSVALPAGKTMDDYTDKPNNAAKSFHGMCAGFHRRQADQLAEKDPPTSKFHKLAAHAHEAAKYAHAEQLPSADKQTDAATTASKEALFAAAEAAKKDKKGKGK